MDENTAAKTPSDSEGQSPVAATGDLEARIQYLEAQNEGIKRVGALGLVLLLIIGGLFVFQVWTDLKGIATGGLVLHDDSRQGRVALTVPPQGGLALVPIDALRGAPGLKSVDGPPIEGLSIYDASGQLRIVIGTCQDQPVMGIFNTDGRVIWSALPLEKPRTRKGTPTPSPRVSTASPSATVSPSATASPSAPASPSLVTPSPTATVSASPTPQATP